jgi:hypothetical protein
LQEERVPNLSNETGRSDVSPGRITLACLIVCLLLTGCGGISGEPPVTADELTSVREGAKAAVVIRIDGEDQDGKALRPFATFGAITLRIGDEETGGELSTVTIPGGLKKMGKIKYLGRFLSKESRDDGWLVLFLPPGFYYVTLLASKPPVPPPWRVEVPSGVSVIYAGTIYLSAEAENVFSVIRDIKKINTIRLENESDQAAAFARRDLGSLPAPVTHLAVQHSGPYRFGIPSSTSM